MTRDGVAGLICVALALALWVLSRGLPQSTLVPIGPDYYPRFVIVIMGFLAALLIVTDVLGKRKKTAAGPAAAKVPADFSRNYPLVGATFAIFALYVAALPFAGYRVATFLFVAALQSVFERPPGARRWAFLLFAALVSALLSHLVFESYLSVLLPRGRWTGF